MIFCGYLLLRFKNVLATAPGPSSLSTAGWRSTRPRRRRFRPHPLSRSGRCPGRRSAELWAITLTNWHKGSRRLTQWLADEGRLAPSWTVDTAADMLSALMSPDLLDRLLIDRRWSSKRFADQFAILLQSTFVAAGE
jgi:hypothetical protein